MLKWIEIGYFKAFGTTQKIEFAQPTPDLIGLTVLVGPNNSGKSTALAALKLLRENETHAIFDRSDRRTGNAPVLKLSFDRGSGACEVEVVGNADEAYLLKQVTTPNQQRDFTRGDLSFLRYVPSRRPWSATFNPMGSANKDTLDEQELTRSRNSEASLGQSLRELIRTKQKAAFDDDVRAILPDMKDWNIDRIGGQDVLTYQSRSGVWHEMSLMGDGFASVFRIVYTLFSSDPGDVVLLDEPELSLHPQAQASLYRYVVAHALDKQIVVATHSTNFINWRDLAKGARLYRVRTKPDGDAEIRELQNSTVQAIKPVADSIKNRKLFDAVSKEVFFADSVIFAEGQEDVHITSAYLEEAGARPLPFFGYGAGGASVIGGWLQMADDLGLKAVGLFDGDHASMAQSIAARFSGNPNIFIATLPKDDIRDKHLRDGKCATTGNCKEIGTVHKHGYFDVHWKIKPSEKANFDAFIAIIRSKL